MNQSYEFVLNASKKFNYDALTGDLTWKENSGSARKGDVAGWVNNQGYLRVGTSGTSVACHRIAWVITYGNLPEIIDHIDGDRTNNTLTNLRAATNSQNLANRGMTRINTSGFKGVHYRWGKWQAAVYVMGKKIHIGSFETAQKAHDAYKAKAASVFGEFAHP